MDNAFPVVSLEFPILVQGEIETTVEAVNDVPYDVDANMMEVVAEFI